MGSIQIRGEQILNATIGSAKIEGAAITSSLLADDSVIAAKIQTGAVTSDALGTGAIVAAALSADCVTNAAIATGAVNADSLAAGSVGSSAVAALAITEGLIANGAVSNSKLGAGSVQTANVGDSQITKAKLSSSAVDSTVMDMTAVYDFTSGTVRVPTTPTNTNDAASKSYVDGLSAGATFKDAVVVALDSNIDLSDLPATVDSQSLSVDDRFLAKSQTTQSQNGVYLYKGTGNAAVRSDDLSSGNEFPGAAVFCLKGSNADRGFICTNDAVNLGSDSITFTQFTGLGQVSVAAPITKTGDQIGLASAGITEAFLSNGAVTNSKLGDLSVSTAKLQSGSVDQSKLANDSVGSAQIIGGAVGNSELDNGSISTAKLQDDCVNSSKLATGSVTSDALGSAAVLTSAINDGAVTAQKLAADCVTNSAIADGSIDNSAFFGAGVVDSNALANAAVSSSKIASGAVGTSALANTSVDSSKLADSSVTAVKLGISFKQEGFQISGSSTTTIDLNQTLPSGALNSVLVFRNGLSIKNMTALGDTAADNDEFNVSASGGGSGKARLTFGGALTNGDSIVCWYFH